MSQGLRQGCYRPIDRQIRLVFWRIMTDLTIRPYAKEHKQTVLDLTLEAWTPVFEKTRQDVPSFAYDAFYPNGWQTRQLSDVGTLLDTDPQDIWLAWLGEQAAGYLGIKLHPEDQMGEIYIIAVSPRFQRQGISTRLMTFAEDHIRHAGMKMIMVETIGDRGHEPARRSYEAFGFEPWPVARYFKEV